MVNTRASPRYMRAVRMAAPAEPSALRELEDAASRGDLKMCAEIIDSGACREDARGLALCAAAANGHYGVCALLLQFGFAYTGRSNTPLVKAARGGHFHVCHLLLHENMPADYAALHAACESGHFNVCWLLLTELYDKQGLRADVNDSQLLLVAAQHGHYDVCALLIERGAYPTARDSYALVVAAKHGHTAVCRLLINSGADASQHGGRALSFAVDQRNLELVELLGENGGAEHNRDALGIAVKKRDVAMCRVLLEESVIPPVRITVENYRAAKRLRNPELRELLLDTARMRAAATGDVDDQEDAWWEHADNEDETEEEEDY